VVSPLTVLLVLTPSPLKANWLPRVQSSRLLASRNLPAQCVTLQAANEDTSARLL